MVHWLPEIWPYHILDVGSFFLPQIIKRSFSKTHKFLAKSLQKIQQKLFLNLWTYIILPFRGKLSWLGPSIKDVSNSEGGRGYGSKLVENCWWIKVKTYMTKWGRGLSKNRGKNADVFYGWSLSWLGVWWPATFF